MRLLRLIIVRLGLLLHVAAPAEAGYHNDVSPQAQPNIILFMTDDQDVTANSLDYMPRLNRLFRNEGMEFLNYYVPTGLCCPSRASILRGQYCHNTEIFDNGDLTNATYQSGAWAKYLDNGLEDETIATLMKSAGYETALIGKYLNGYTGEKAASHKPPGFDHWMGMLQMSFFGPSFSDNGRFLQLNDTIYQTDFIRDWSIDFLTNKRDQSKPFFLMVTPFAPHTPAIPAKRHENMFQDVKFPRFDSFNPPDDIQLYRPSWIKDLPLLTQEQIDDMDNFYRNRLRSLQAVDEALESLVDTLRDLRIDDKTYVFYTADNGQHFGDHRIPSGKRQAYETDVLVPFLVRGPGVQHGAKVSQVVQSVDLAPTFLDFASKHSNQQHKLASSYPMDGKSMVLLLSGKMPLTPDINKYRWAALLEMYGGSSNMGERYKNMSAYYQNHMFPNTYQAARVINGPDWAKGNLLYVEWCTGEQELFNMTEDPHQVNNIASSTDLHLLNHLSQLLARLGDCKGPNCYQLDSVFTESDATTPERQLLSFDSMQAMIRKRIPCYNPPSMSSIDITLGRKQFAASLHVPEPFTFGFPFSDGDVVLDDLMEIWREYEQYFH